MRVSRSECEDNSVSLNKRQIGPQNRIVVLYIWDGSAHFFYLDRVHNGLRGLGIKKNLFSILQSISHSGNFSNELHSLFLPIQTFNN